MSSEINLSPGVTECDAQIREVTGHTRGSSAVSWTTDRAPSPADTIMEGNELFSSFLNAELQNKGLNERVTAMDFAEDGGGDSVSRCPSSVCNNNLSRMGATGRALRKLADNFAKSSERKDVSRQANEVELSHLSKNEFFQLLQSLFKDGITQERIVVLFFFCCDLAIRALLEKQVVKVFRQLVRWSLNFLQQEICTWVQKQGGWAQVLSTSVNYVYKTSVIIGALAVTLAAAIYIKKNM